MPAYPSFSNQSMNNATQALNTVTMLAAAKKIADDREAEFQASEKKRLRKKGEKRLSGLGDVKGGFRKGRMKGPGFFGELESVKGKTATELSMDEEGGEYPALVPTLNKHQIEKLLAGQKPGKDIRRKAKEHAGMRKASGLSPFAGQREVSPSTVSYAERPEKEPTPPVDTDEAINKDLERVGKKGISYADKVRALLGMSRGGRVSGPAPSHPKEDTVPAMLQPGEYVIRKKAAEEIGEKKLNKLNSLGDVGPPEGKSYVKGYYRGGRLGGGRNAMGRMPQPPMNYQPPIGRLPMGLMPQPPEHLWGGPMELQPMPGQANRLNQFGRGPNQARGYAKGGGIEPGTLPGNTIDSRIEWADRLGRFDYARYFPFSGSPGRNYFIGQGTDWGGSGPQPHTPRRKNRYMGGPIEHLYRGGRAGGSGKGRSGVQIGYGGRGGRFDPNSVSDNPFSVPRDMLDPRSTSWFYGGVARMNPFQGFYQPPGQPGYYPPPGQPGTPQGPTYNPSYFDPQGYPWGQPAGATSDVNKGGSRQHTPPPSKE